MCGIVGAFPLNVQGLDLDVGVRRRATMFLHNEVLLETVARGRDATGMALTFGRREDDPEGSYLWTVLKQPVDTGGFFLNDGTDSRYNGQDEGANLDNLMAVAFNVERPLLHILGHTRAKTIGSEYSPLNNHPIMVGNIIGVHNGGVKNTDEIYKLHPEMTLQGEVDSEAIFQLLAENANERALGAQDIKYVTQRIVGPRAVFAYNKHYPEQVLFFRDKDRPLELAFLPELGLAILLSEKKFLNAALFVYHRVRMSAARDFPELSVRWMPIEADKGGVIDITTPVDIEAPLSESFPLIDTAKVLDQYEPPSKTTYNFGWGGSSQHTQQGGGSNRGYNRNIGFKTTSSTGSSSSSSSFNNSSSSSASNSKPGALVKAELVDISTYGPEKTRTVDVSDADVMDDPEDTGGNVGDTYTLPELVKRGADWALGTEAKKDKSLLVHRYEGKYKDYVNIPSVRESEAAELVTQLWAESFGEGYAKGYKDGASEQAESDHGTVGDTRVLEKEVETLREKLLESKTKQRRAAAYIANMKAFLMAAILTHDLASVGENEEGKFSLEFDSDLEDFLHTASGFEKSSPDMIRDLFGERDLQVIARGFSRTARKVANEVGSQARQVAKSIKS